jgi:hypothetical protein
LRRYTQGGGGYGGAAHSRWDGAVHAALTLLCPPAASAWLAKSRRRAATDVALLMDHYDRQGLHSFTFQLNVSA